MVQYIKKVKQIDVDDKEFEDYNKSYYIGQVDIGFPDLPSKD